LENKVFDIIDARCNHEIITKINRLMSFCVKRAVCISKNFSGFIYPSISNVIVQVPNNRIFNSTVRKLSLESCSHLAD